MADSVVKLRIDSKEADANIKHTGQALADYFRKVREGDGTFAKLDEGVMEAIKAIREMGTKADSTRGALRELTQATTDLTAAYRSLDNEALQSDTGKELSKTIEILTQRAGEAKDAMGDVSAAITSSASDTRGFDQIAGGISLMTSGFQTAVGAANLFGLEIGNQEKVLTTLASAMSITNGLQTVQNLLQSQSALMMGVQAAQASLATAAQTALAAATGSATIAQKAFNVVANANPYVLLATAVTAVAAALYAFVSGADEAEKEAEELAKAQEEAKKKADDARNAFVNASAEAMNSASRLNSLQVAYMNANSEMEKTSILKQAQEQFKKLGIECNGVNDAQTLLIKNGSAVLEMIRLQGTVAALSAVRMEAFKNSFKMLMENGYSASAASILAGANGDVMELDEQITQMQTRIQGLKDTLHINENKGGTTRTVTKNKVTPEEILPEGSVAALTKQMQELQKEQKLVTSYSGWQEYQQKIEAVSDRISLLKGELPKNKEAVFTVTAETQDAIDKLRDIDGVKIDPKGVTVTAETSEAIAALQRVDGLTIQPKTAEVTFTANDADVLAKVRDIEGVKIDPKGVTVTAETSDALRSVQELIGGLEGTIIQLKVKAEPQDTAIGTSIQNSAGLSEYISDLQKQLSTANFATPLYNNLQAQLADTTTLQNLVGEALKVGLGTALFDVADETGADFWTRAMEGGVKNIDWQAILDEINEARKAAGLDAISLDFASGSVTEEKKGKDSLQDSKTVLNAISQLTSGLESIGIEIPSEIQSVISVMQGVIQVIEAVNAIIGVTQTTALTANTIAMTSLTTALWANTATSWIPGLAGGGIVPHFAGGGLIGKAALGMTIPGRSYSGDLLRLPVDGGRGMIGVNSGEIVMNQAQAGILESELSGGRMRDINVHGVLQGENIVLAVSNYFRRTGKGEAAMWGKN